MDEPWCLVVAGVSGAGKSTIAERIAAITGAVLADGDDFHSAEAVRAMSSGIPLTDADRWPWLDAIGAWIDDRYGASEHAVISCSALRRAYRDRLASGRPWVRFCLLDVPVEELRRRLDARAEHFMPATLLSSQRDLLEPLEADESGAIIEASGPPEAVAAAAVRRLRLG